MDRIHTLKHTLTTPKKYLRQCNNHNIFVNLALQKAHNWQIRVLFIVQIITICTLLPPSLFRPLIHSYFRSIKSSIIGISVDNYSTHIMATPLQHGKVFRVWNSTAQAQASAQPHKFQTNIIRPVYDLYKLRFDFCTFVLRSAIGLKHTNTNILHSISQRIDNSLCAIIIASTKVSGRHLRLGKFISISISIAILIMLSHVKRHFPACSIYDDQWATKHLRNICDYRIRQSLFARLFISCNKQD